MASHGSIGSEVAEMLNRIKQATFSKKGEAYIYVCVLVLSISMLVSVVILYMGLLAQVQIQKRDVKNKLDSCVAEYATEAFDSIKQGDNYELLDLEKLKENAYRHLGFGSDDTSITYDNGNCTMSRPTVTTLSGNGFGLTATYTVSFPISWGGKTFADLQVPITVTSYYRFK